MIKKLRIKFIAAIMVIVTLMLLVIFGLMLRSTYASMRKGNLETMRQYAMELQQPGNRPGEKPGRRAPMFSLRTLPNGDWEVTGDAGFDLSDELTLLLLYTSAMGGKSQTGIFPDWDLQYYLDHGTKSVIFMDISPQRQMLYDLLINCCFLFAAAVAVFFVISLLLSKWIIRPVEDAWNRQRQFVADASHELKTPLTVILTNAELLDSEAYDDMAKKRFSGSILSMARQMRGLVESLLDLARVDSGKLREQMEETELSALVEEGVLSFEPVYFEAGRELRSAIEPEIRVLGSGSHLRQVIDILLDNGCKYGEPGQAVLLELKRHGRGKCLLQITSQGPCLTKRQCRDIFKRFYRVDEARTMNRSYGLGLPIAESIVAAHQGKIWAESTARGNTFFVLLSTL